MIINSADKVILWTGGWDSTFRVLSILREPNGANIVPVYLLDTSRKSTIYELETIHKIKKQLFENDKYYSDKLMPMLIVDSTDIPKIPEIRLSYNTIKKTNWLGSQYIQLAEMSRYLNLSYPEMALIRDGGVLQRVLHMDPTKNKNVLSLPKDEKFSECYYNIFRYYSFPLISKSKIDIREEALNKGIIEELEMSWFCHEPRNGVPCGLCGPCQYALENGLGYRLPFFSRMICQVKVVIKQIRRKIYGGQ